MGHQNDTPHGTHTSRQHSQLVFPIGTRQGGKKHDLAVAISGTRICASADATGLCRADRLDALLINNRDKLGGGGGARTELQFAIELETAAGNAHQDHI